MEDAAELLEDCGSSKLLDDACDGTEDNSNMSKSNLLAVSDAVNGTEDSSNMSKSFPASHSLVLGSANRRSGRRLEMQLVKSIKDTLQVSASVLKKKKTAN